MGQTRGICLYDGDLWLSLLPLTYLKPVGALRAGIETLGDAWGSLLKANVAYATQPHLRELWGGEADAHADSRLHILGGLLPHGDVVEAVRSLQPGEALHAADRLLAAYPTQAGVYNADALQGMNLRAVQLEAGVEVVVLQHPWDIFRHAGMAIADDYERITHGRHSQPVSSTVGVLGNGGIFLEAGAQAEFCTFNTTEGPIYLGEGAEVMEGSHIRGPFALGAHSTIKMGAKIYGGTAIGPHCKVGGEVSNTVFQSYSNKGHDGFLGNAAIGSWCNLGADTNCSNLKNTYEPVRAWSVAEERFVETGLQFCGLMMGDHSKSGINTMFNTGSTVGAFCNVFGDGFPRAWVPSFSWGGASGMREHGLPMALRTAEAVLARRHEELSATLRTAIEMLFALTASERPYGG